MNPWLIYLWGISEGVKITLGMVAIFAVVGGTAAFGVCYMDGVEEALPTTKRVIICGLIAGLVALFVPSQKTIALMYVLPRVAESEAIQRDVPELYRLAVDALKDQLTDGVGGQR